jgi:hypothetical protein
MNPQKNKPGDYPVGSLESRVAARATLDRIEAERKKDLRLVRIEFRGCGDEDRILEFYEPKKGGNR